MSYYHVRRPVVSRRIRNTNLFSDVPESSVHHSVNSVHQFLWSQTVDIRRIRVDTARMPIPSNFGQLRIRFPDRRTLGLGHEEGDQVLLDQAEVLPGFSDFDVRRIALRALEGIFLHQLRVEGLESIIKLSVVQGIFRTRTPLDPFLHHLKNFDAILGGGQGRPRFGLSIAFTEQLQQRNQRPE